MFALGTRDLIGTMIDLFSFQNHPSYLSFRTVDFENDDTLAFFVSYFQYAETDSIIFTFSPTIFDNSNLFLLTENNLIYQFAGSDNLIFMFLDSTNEVYTVEYTFVYEMNNGNFVSYYMDSTSYKGLFASRIFL